jgi:hypothetical protein
VGIQLVQLKLNLYDMISITVQKMHCDRAHSIVEKGSRSLHSSEKTGSAAKVDLD